MISIKNLFLPALIPFIALSCMENPGSKNAQRISSLPNVTGAAGEVLTVMDNNLWKSASGNKLRESLEQEYPALPQPEPLFDVIYIPNGAFDDLFKMHRSIIMTDVSSVHKAAVVTYSENVWAKPQIVVKIMAPNPEILDSLIDTNVAGIINQLKQYDRKRLADVYRFGKDLSVKNILTKFHINLAIPRGYNIDIDAADFASLSIETSESSQVIFIYRYPYYDINDFSANRLIEKRNGFLKKYTQGSRAGSHMTTSELFPPLVYDVKLDSRDFVELRGLWELNKGYMGGPFISHSTLDSIRNEIVTVEGYVYHPNNKKRNMMRQMEAIVYSLEVY